jgi:hypothetical protein
MSRLVFQKLPVVFGVALAMKPPAQYLINKTGAGRFFERSRQ